MTPNKKKHRSSSDSPAFGDWRVPVDNPLEAVHMKPTRLLSLKRAHLRTEYLQSAPTSQWIQETMDGIDWHPIRGWQCWLRRALAVLVLLPLSLITVMAVLLQFYHAAPAFEQFSFWLSEPVWFSLLGAVLFVSLKTTRLFDPVLIFIYVVGHEMTHALTVLCSFGRVHDVKIDLSGGYVETESDNLIIALSPYFVPLWMLLWMGVVWLADVIYPFEEANAWFYAGFGFWWSFHLFWTCWVIPREQPDMLENGLLFSMLFIIITNIAVLVGVLACFGAISMTGFWADFKVSAQGAYAFCRDIAQAVCAAVQTLRQ